MPLSTKTEDRLDAAAKAGDLDLLKSILSEEEDQIKPEDLGAPLYTAVDAKHADVAAYLLSQGAQLGRYLPQAALPANGSSDMYQVFLDHGWDVNFKTVRGMPFVQLILDDEPLLDWFLAHGADVNARSDRWNSTALDLAAQGESLAVVKFLVQHGAKLEEANPLHSAASSEDNSQEIMSYFLDLGVDINAISTFGVRMNKRRGDEDGTPLHAAIRGENTNNINFLLDRGADPSMKTVMGDTAIEYAQRHGYDDGKRALEQWQKKQ